MEINEGERSAASARSPMLRRLALGLTVVFAAATGFLGMIAVNGTQSSSSAAAVEACTVLVEGSFDEGSRCLFDAYGKAYATGTLADFQSALYVRMQSSVALAKACHEPGHEAGREALNRAQDAAGLLGKVGSLESACSNAFLHGVLDQLATLNPGADEYADVVKACSATTAGVLDSCSDGLGHSLWLSGKGMPFAVSVCEQFAEWESGRCLGGVVMQMLRPDPFTGAPATLTAESTPAQWAKVCREVEALGVNTRMVESCWSEVGGAAVIPVDMLFRTIMDRVGERRPADVERLNAAWAEAFGKCGQLGEYADNCRERIAYAVSWRVGDDAEWMAATCPVFGEEWGKRCLESRSLTTVNAE